MTTSGRRSSSSGAEEDALRRTGPAPRGLDPVDEARLATLPGVVRQLRHTLRYVDYRQAEDDCEALAARLLAAYPRSELAGFAARGIPRGGLIVLGMLAYMLDLAPEQLSGGAEAGRPLLLVDDCALSGARFRTALQARDSPRVVFAHLYSHPALRAAIVESEESVDGCLAARDLNDYARELYGDDYERWRTSAWEHVSGKPYWLGLPDLVCFPWSEPDRPIWNPASEALEEGWRLLPPHRCLKARAGLGPPPLPVEEPEWQVAAGVITLTRGERIWLYSLTTDQVHALAGTGAEMWLALATWGSIDAGVRYLAGRYEAEESTLRRDLETLAARLVESRLLEPAGGRPRCAS